MRWLVRADSSVQIGAGHVARCLTLAGRVRARGAQVEFLCRELPGALTGQIRAAGFEVHGLSGTPEQEWAQVQAVVARAPVDWLAVDHYGIDAQWERALRPQVGAILVIDDLANRPHDCDVLLDQGSWPDPRARYAGLLPEGCLRLLGPAWLLLRDEFLQGRAQLQRRFGPVGRVLVNFGGTDAPNLSLLALQALLALPGPAPAVDLVIGATNPHRASLEQALRGLPDARLHVQASNMAALIASADLAIGACGGSTWERCYLGLPSLAYVLADNQREAAQWLAQQGAIVNLGDAAQASVQGLAQQLTALMHDAPARERLARQGWALMGEGPQDWTDQLLARSRPRC